MLKKSLSIITLTLLASSQIVFAFQPKETARYFNGPTITQVGESSAQVSLSQAVLNGITPEEKSGVYFQYYETQMMCIAIYPTPEYCLPKKTEVGKTEATLTNLKPGTSYTVVYKRDNTIRCITTPCPGNEFESLSVEFTTNKAGTGNVMFPKPNGDVTPITNNLSYRSRGVQVTTLQTVLISQGYMTGTATGYFGVITLKAVKDFQRSHSITPTGFVGPLTRAVLAKMTVSPYTSGSAESFEGTVTAYSTACFADGECSITVDGKKVVTTIGWSQMTVGQVLGIPDFGSIESNIGAHAKVYAKKTEDGYTLYGSKDYYILITPLTKGKLPAGSQAPSDGAQVKAHTWVWQKTVMASGSTVTPNKTGMFTLSFDNNGSLTGKTDCNGFFGSYTFGTDGFIKFGPLGSTLMYCDGSQEQVFTEAVGKVDRYSIDGDGNLLLLLSGNEGTVYFVKK